MPNSPAVFEMSSYPKATCCFSTQPHSTLHLHRHLEFICILKGKVEFTINGKTCKLSDGDSAIIMPYTTHSYHPLTENCERFVLVFEPEYIASLSDILLNNRPIDPIISGDRMREEFTSPTEMFWTIAQNVRKADTDSLSYVQSFSQLAFFLGRILTLTGLTRNSGIKNKLYLNSVALCNTQYVNPSFDIDHVANQLHVSSSRIQQLFSEHMNISFKKYITLLRISRAKALLRESSMSISEIATASGFNSTRTFNRIFKAHKNLSPIEYKKQAANDSSL